MGGGTLYEDLKERGYVGPFSFSLPLPLSLSAEWDNTVSLPDSYHCGLISCRKEFLTRYLGFVTKKKKGLKKSQHRKETKISSFAEHCTGILSVARILNICTGKMLSLYLLIHCMHWHLQICLHTNKDTHTHKHSIITATFPQMFYTLVFIAYNWEVQFKYICIIV